MDETSKPRRAGHSVTCPVCEGTGRSGSPRTVCTVCWWTGEIPWWRYEHLLKDYRRGHRPPCPDPGEPDEPNEPDTGPGLGMFGLAA